MSKVECKGETIAAERAASVAASLCEVWLDWTSLCHPALASPHRATATEKRIPKKMPDGF
jgi:hypothetical protein